MCYSKESSITAFIVGSISSLYLITCSKNNFNKHIGLFLFSVTLMQFAEYLLWYDQKCGLINKTTSKLLPIVLTLQPLAIFVGAYIYNTMNIPLNILILIITILTIIMVYLLHLAFTLNGNWCTRPNENNSLQWANIKYIWQLGFLYYGVFIVSPFLFKSKWRGIMLFLVGLITYLFTRYPNFHTSYSRWCYFSAYTPLLFIIVDIIGIK
jgi:hypothetical protein